MVDAIVLSFLHYSKKAKVMITAGMVIVVLSIIGIIYAGSLVIKDETTGNIGGTSSLPKTAVGPLSVYHVEYGSVFVLIAGSALLVWGYVNRKDRKIANK